MDYLIDDFGACGDGQTLDTGAIQAAIDAAHEAGGGRVVLTPGRTYVAGSIVLRTAVELHVTLGSTLRASPRFEDYSVVQHGVVQMDEPESAHSMAPTASFLFSEGAKDIAITGRGTIDGNGRSYVLRRGEMIHDAAVSRAFTIHFRDVDRLLLSDVRVIDGALWTIRLSRCDDAVVHAITIDNDLLMPNSDGIDIDACRRVRISDCTIRAGDDAICLKAARESTLDGRVCEDVTVTGCTLVSSSTAILCGVECETAIRDVVFSSCVITNSNRGIAVSLHERGTIERIRFENIVVNTRMFADEWWGHGEPIYVAAVPRNDAVGVVRDIVFSGITARSERGVFLYGGRPETVMGIRLLDVTVTIVDPGRLSPHIGDIRPASEDGLFSDPVSGFRLHGTEDVLLRDCAVTWAVDDRSGYADAVTETRSETVVIEAFRESSRARRVEF